MASVGSCQSIDSSGGTGLWLTPRFSALEFRRFEAWVGKAEVLLEQAIEALDQYADELTGHDEEPIPLEARRELFVRMAGETFDRIRKCVS